MKLSRKTGLAIILIGVIISISLYCTDAERVETQYSKGFFPGFAAAYRILSGNIPFSIGDIFYGIFIGWLVYKTFRFFFRKGERWKRFVKGILIILSVSIIFDLFWGINYSRKGIAHQLQVAPAKYTASELSTLNCALIEKVNFYRNQIGERLSYPDSKTILKNVPDVFLPAEKQFPFLKYKHSSLKSSLWGWLGNYIGFTGYYNPFTAEAQVNTNVPVFMIPYIACHEVAHQLGYAKENEANFVGYLAATSTVDPFFKYSAYLDLFQYANRKMYFIDSSAARLYKKELNNNVLNDIKEWAAFNRKYSSPFEPLIWWAYGKFLEQHRQPQGIKSYDEVISFLISYQKKTGKL